MFSWKKLFTSRVICYKMKRKQSQKRSAYALYYLLLTLSVLLFGVGFLCNDRYTKIAGSEAVPTVMFLIFSNLAGVIVMLVINRFRVEFTLFTLMSAALASLNAILYTFFTLKSLTHINLSLYSVFAMLGGMMLPFLAGLIFYHEALTLGKGVCVILIIAALALTVKRDGQRGGTVYYIGVFVCNGMSGVLTKLFLEAPYEKTSAESYSIWIALITLAAALCALPFLRRKLQKPDIKAVLWSTGCGAAGRIGNYLLVLALAVLPASVQYPFVTGGTIIVSTLLGYAVGQRPSRRELLAVALSFVGVLLLSLI